MNFVRIFVHSGIDYGFALMSYYQTTYMSVVIRCYELGIFDTQDSDLMEILLYNNSEEKQKKLFENIPMRNGESFYNGTDL